jgi:hypothetical protein
MPVAYVVLSALLRRLNYICRTKLLILLALQRLFQQTVLIATFLGWNYSRAIGELLQRVINRDWGVTFLSLEHMQPASYPRGRLQTNSKTIKVSGKQ